ncbi:hypothetical protein [Massilia sp. UBA6681]|uniref:hypothetical protein n=1 Tax=Massilia sp. UBA6681 TaxID=1946839 RepID=UPI0025B869C9|nr:hypothetical protein [Massilia sp. UBA6681]
MFDITLLPAAEGDAIWIEYGEGDARHHICIDGGPFHTFPALCEHARKCLPSRNRTVELLVISHIDGDHIEGVVRMLAGPRTNWLFYPDEIWFNGYHHLLGNTLGARDGEYLSALLRKHAPQAWNKSFHGVAVIMENVPQKPMTLPGGMEITLLSPNRDKLGKLRGKWRTDLSKAGLAPGDDKRTLARLHADRRYRKAGARTLGKAGTDEIEELFRQVDDSAANGSSIAFLAHFKGASCLFLADAHADILASSIKAILPEGAERLEVDAVKVSHHGSSNNISDELLGLIDARHYLFSTNGARHLHPHQATIDAILQHSLKDPVLWFNHRSPSTAPFEQMQGRRTHRTEYPASPEAGMTLQLLT